MSIMTNDLKLTEMECGYIKYSTQQQARKTMRDIAKRKSGAAKRVYYCETCQAWHITHKDTKPKRNNKRRGE